MKGKWQLKTLDWGRMRKYIEISGDNWVEVHIYYQQGIDPCVNSISLPLVELVLITLKLGNLAQGFPL